MRFACLIVSYNGERWIMRCLESIGAAVPPPYSVWVVDNASQDGTVECVRSSFPHVQITLNTHNRGFAGGVNCGVRALLAEEVDYVVLVNQDMIVEPDWLKELEAVATKSPPGIFGALEVTYDGKGLDPVSRSALYQQSPEMIDDLLFGRLKDAYAANTVYGGCMAIHRSVFDRIGLFDETFFMYCEDIDFCRRAMRAGFKISILPYWRVRHHSSMSSEGGYASPRIARLNRRGWMVLTLKNPSKSFARSFAGEIRNQVFRLWRNGMRLRIGDCREILEDTLWLVKTGRRILAARRRDMLPD